MIYVSIRQAFQGHVCQKLSTLWTNQSFLFSCMLLNCHDSSPTCINLAMQRCFLSCFKAALINGHQSKDALKATMQASWYISRPSIQQHQSHLHSPSCQLLIWHLKVWSPNNIFFVCHFLVRRSNFWSFRTFLSCLIQLLFSHY